MKKKHYLLIIAGLIILNLLTLTAVIFKPEWYQTSGEKVAVIGNDSISRQEWLNEMEARYGENILKELIDRKVIEQMAIKNNITVTEEEIERELTLLKTTSYLPNLNDDQLRQQIKYSLLLEEIFTKDAVVSEKEMKKYYNSNKSQFAIPTSYHLSQIIVSAKKEADQTIKELKQGSSFSVLAMERSIDEFSANQGGNIGFVSEEDERISINILEALKGLKEGNWTQPVKTEEGYSIFLLHEKIPEKNYSYKDVKNQIRRQLALEQMDMSVTADIFWDEVNVEWFYGNKTD